MIIFKSLIFLSIISSIMFKILSEDLFIIISLSSSKNDLLKIPSLNSSKLEIISLSS